MILYKQFNFGLASQTFGLVTSSNSLPEGQPHLFIFVSPCDDVVMSCEQAYLNTVQTRHKEFEDTVIFVIFNRAYSFLSAKSLLV